MRVGCSRRAITERSKHSSDDETGHGLGVPTGFHTSETDGRLTLSMGKLQSTAHEEAAFASQGVVNWMSPVSASRTPGVAVQSLLYHHDLSDTAVERQLTS